MIETRNVKISLKTSAVSLNNASVCLDTANINHKCYNNFITFKSEFAFVLFKPSKNNINHINVSKLKTKQDIEQSVSIIKKVFAVKVISAKVDNIVATTNLDRKLDLCRIVKANIFKKAKYNPEQFPGLFVGLTKGSAILFHSGKTVIVGCKRNKDVRWVVKEIIATLKI